MTWLKHKGKYFNTNENKWKSVCGHDCEGGSMSKTPRTDEHLRMKEKNGHAVIVSRDFARQLETELAEKDRQLAEAWAEIERLKHIKRCLREEFLLNTQNYPKEYHALFQRKFKAALSAAERGGK